MVRNCSRLLVLVLSSTLSVAAVADKLTSETSDLGRWLTESGNFEVEIAPCGDALCGTVTKVLGNRSMSNSAEAPSAVDPNSLLGLKLLTGFKPAGESRWLGQIYNREDGNTYQCVMTLLSPKQLKVRAYRVLPIFGKSQVWTRVAG